MLRAVKNARIYIAKPGRADAIFAVDGHEIDPTTISNDIKIEPATADNPHHKVTITFFCEEVTVVNDPDHRATEVRRIVDQAFKENPNR